MKKLTLKVFPDGNWDESDETPEKVVVSIKKEGMELIAKAMNFLKSGINASQLEILSDLFAFEFLDGDDQKYEKVQMLWTGNVVVGAEDIYFRVGTKHGYGYVMTETAPFDADEVINPKDSFTIVWDTSCIIEYDDDNFVTLETARKILGELEGIDAAGKGVGFSDLEDCLSRIQTIPDEYFDVANELDINQFFNPCYVTDVDTTTLIFFDALKESFVTAENMEDVIGAVESDLRACGEGYTICEALDQAKHEFS